MNGTSTGTILYDSATQNLILNGAQYIPIGSLLTYAGLSAPSGWLLCEGQILPIINYSNLFNVIGSTYGGDGTTTFALPDLRGRVPVGSGQLNGNSTNYPRGASGGSENRTLTVNEMPSHTHTGTINSVGNHDHTYQDAYYAENRGLPGNDKYGTASSSDFDNNFIYRTQNGGYSYYPSDITTSSAGSHSHTMSNSSTGGDGSFSIVQPYLVMSYIIKY